MLRTFARLLPLANEAEGLEYNGKQCKSFGHKLVLGALGDRPETFRRGSPICLDGGRLGRFFFPIFFRRENRLLLRTFFHCLLSGGLVSLRVCCFSIQFCPVQIPSLLIHGLFLLLRDAYVTPALESEKRFFHVKFQSRRVSLEGRDGKGRVQFDVEDSVMIYRSR